jgi:hypothetical protein
MYLILQIDRRSTGSELVCMIVRIGNRGQFVVLLQKNPLLSAKNLFKKQLRVNQGIGENKIRRINSYGVKWHDFFCTVNERLEGVKGEGGERKGGARGRRRNKTNNNNNNNKKKKKKKVY